MAQQKYLLFGQSQAGKTTLRELLSLCLDRGGRLVQKENEVPVVMADRSTMMKSVLRYERRIFVPLQAHVQK